MNNHNTTSSTISKTPIERCMFGLDAEINNNPTRFFNFEYISGIIRQENIAKNSFTKTFKTLIVFNTISLFYLQGIKLNFEIFGVGIKEIPGSTQALCFLLGLSIFGFAINNLDVILFARIRYLVINKCLNTDLTNIATAHLKHDGLWVDLICPKFIGYSSGKFENRYLRYLGRTLNIFICTIFIASLSSLISIFIFGLNGDGIKLDWPTIISSSGLIIGTMGVLIFFCVQFIPFKYTLPEIYRNLNTDEGAALFRGKK